MSSYLSVIETGHLDVNPPEIGEKVWIPMKWERVGIYETRRRYFYVEVIYTNEHELPLMFHSLDLSTGYPEIKDYVRIVERSEFKYEPNALEKETR